MQRESADIAQFAVKQAFSISSNPNNNHQRRMNIEQ
jgi:hypothetical protein